MAPRDTLAGPSGVNHSDITQDSPSAQDSHQARRDNILSRYFPGPDGVPQPRLMGSTIHLRVFQLGRLGLRACGILLLLLATGTVVSFSFLLVPALLLTIGLGGLLAAMALCSTALLVLPLKLLSVLVQSGASFLVSSQRSCDLSRAVFSSSRRRSQGGGGASGAGGDGHDEVWHVRRQIDEGTSAPHPGSGSGRRAAAPPGPAGASPPSQPMSAQRGEIQPVATEKQADVPAPDGPSQPAASCGNHHAHGKGVGRPAGESAREGVQDLPPLVTQIERHLATPYDEVLRSGEAGVKEGQEDKLGAPGPSQEQGRSGEGEREGGAEGEGEGEGEEEREGEAEGAAAEVKFDEKRIVPPTPAANSAAAAAPRAAIGGTNGSAASGPAPGETYAEMANKKASADSKGSLGADPRAAEGGAATAAVSVPPARAAGGAGATPGAAAAVLPRGGQEGGKGVGAGSAAHHPPVSYADAVVHSEEEEALSDGGGGKGKISNGSSFPVDDEVAPEVAAGAAPPGSYAEAVLQPKDEEANNGQGAAQMTASKEENKEDGEGAGGGKAGEMQVQEGGGKPSTGGGGLAAPAAGKKGKKGKKGKGGGGGGAAKGEQLPASQEGQEEEQAGKEKKQTSRATPGRAQVTARPYVPALNVRIQCLTHAHNNLM